MEATPKFLLIYLVTLVLTISSAFAAPNDDGSPSSSKASNLSINGTKFEDFDANGLRSDDEPGLPGWAIHLKQNGSNLLNATTDDQGQYVFHDLLPGRYEVTEENSPGWNQTFPGGNSYLVTITDKPAYRLDFGNFRSRNITAAHAVREYPRMRPTHEEAHRWVEGYRAAPKAYISPQIKAELSMAAGSAAGSSISLLEYLPYIPSERDQGYCGNCWAWAGTGVMEINDAYNNGVWDRLSIQYLNSNFQGGRGPDWACCGGWLEDVSGFYSITGMAVPWSNANAQWQDGNARCEDRATSVPADTISTNPSYPLTSIQAETIPTQGLGKETAISNIKSVLQQGKAVWFAFFVPNDRAWNGFTSFWSTQDESAVWQPDTACGVGYNYAQGGGHAVLCVGYNDTDPQNRYWIMVNSWGTTPRRPGGLFRMNMDMSYDCFYPDFDYAFYWMTLDIEYPAGPNNPPSAPLMPSGPDSGYSQTSYSYSTSATDPDGDKVKYIFDWGDGASSETNLVNSGDSAFAQHSWSAAGSYQISAVAVDSRGRASESSPAKQVVISGGNHPPSAPAVPTGSTSGYAWSSYAYTTSATDADNDLLGYTFDWGDGTTSEVKDVASGGYASASHYWSAAGTYYLKAKASDGKGGESSWSGPLSVKINANRLPAAPATPLGPVSGYIGVSYSYSASATDPDGDKVKYTFDWGDGTTSETALVKSGSKTSVSHIWSIPGSYQVKARATDSKGGASSWSAALIVTIAANRPPAAPLPPSGINLGKIRTYYSFSTSSIDPEGDQVKYTFDWGDGTTSQTALVNSGTSASSTHRWLMSGTYQVKAKATDSKGSSSAWSGALVVRMSSSAFNNPPLKPTRPAGPSQGRAGVSYQYRTYARDPNGDEINYTVDWGDGSSSEIGPAKSGKSIEAGHIWNAPGIYHIRAEASDNEDISSGWSASSMMKIV